MEDPGGFTGIPLIAYEPNLSLLFGGLLLYRFDVGANGDEVAEGEARPRKSAIQLAAAYTLKNQLLFSLGPKLYLDSETWLASGGLEAVIFPDRLYRPGQHSPDTFEIYSQRLLAASVGLERRVVGQLRAGAGMRVAHAKVTEVEADGLLATDQLPGSDGGLLFAIGPNVAWDDRDVDTAPRSGGRHEVTLAMFPEALGSDFGFTQTIIRLRQYLSPWLDHVVAAELYAELTTGDVPFQMMASLGGSNHMRGYYGGRYRDRHQAVAQLEYRMPVWWRFGVVGFVGAGNVADSLSAFDLDDPKVAGGGGVRFALSPEQRVNLRADFAVTREGDSNLYIGLLEAF